ncbi:MAG TPA: NUDIX domain-containing protein [Chitinophagales bacterium]|nr:NUDIX domain-containing protein [Chitinophagales bacterium]
MHQVATALIFDRNNKLLIYLRDEKPEIPFPGYWDLFGGRVEEGETPEVALMRELKEELDIDVNTYTLYKTFYSPGEARPNTKYVYLVRVPEAAEELTLYEGQYLKGIDLQERANYRFANMLLAILDDYAAFVSVNG